METDGDMDTISTETTLSPLCRNLRYDDILDWACPPSPHVPVVPSAPHLFSGELLDFEYRIIPRPERLRLRGADMTIDGKKKQGGAWPKGVYWITECGPHQMFTGRTGSLHRRTTKENG